MNISAIDYKENVTIARLQKRYLPKRFVPNYSNCLLQKDISSDAFLLKKSGSDDHSCYINSLSSISYVKPRYAKEFNILSHKNPYMNNQKSCDCCIAF